MFPKFMEHHLPKKLCMTRAFRNCQPHFTYIPDMYPCASPGRFSQTANAHRLTCLYIHNNSPKDRFVSDVVPCATEPSKAAYHLYLNVTHGTMNQLETGHLQATNTISPNKTARQLLHTRFFRISSCLSKNPNLQRKWQVHKESHTHDLPANFVSGIWWFNDLIIWKFGSSDNPSTADTKPRNRPSKGNREIRYKKNYLWKPNQEADDSTSITEWNSWFHTTIAWLSRKTP